MINFLRFDSSLPDVEKSTDERQILEPAGLEHARLFVSHLPNSIQVIKGPWNEEDYAWEFVTKCEGVKVSVLTGLYGGGGWLVTVIPVSDFSFLRRRKVPLAVDLVTSALEELLRADPRFRNVRRFSYAEFEAHEEAECLAEEMAPIGEHDFVHPDFNSSTVVPGGDAEMGRGLRLTLGVVFLLAAIGFAALTPAFANAPNGPLKIFSLAGFLGIIAYACFFRFGRPLIVRSIGLVVSGLYAWHVVSAGTLRALMGFCVIGLPAGYVVVTGRYPGWGRAAVAFNPEPQTAKPPPPAPHPLD